MTRLLLATSLVLAACASDAPQTVVSGDMPERPEVRGVSVHRWPDLPARLPPTTTTTHYHPPTTTTAATLPGPEPTRLASGDCGGWADLITQHFGDQATKACSVMACETGGTFDPTIENPRSTASGLFQFLDSTWRSARSLVGADQYARASHAPGSVQIAAAAAWLRETSWSQWECA